MEVRHEILLADVHAHLITVHSTFSGDSLPDPLVVAMPIWTPGSYLVREYARCVENPRAQDDQGRTLAAVKIRKNAWSIAHATGEPARTVRFTYELYCNDLSVRTNHLDGSHLFLNGASSFVFATHDSGAGAQVSLILPPGWMVDTALQPISANEYRADSFDRLCDAPIQAGVVTKKTFVAEGKEHSFSIWGDPIAMSWDDVVRDSKLIVETEAALMGGLPHDRYFFLWMIAAKNRGGLEHEDSCALVVAASAFDDRKSYLEVLALVAHEYLHLWNIKRIRPAALTPYRYEEENYTRLLWWFEGATSYFDWRILRLCGLATVDEYLDHLGEELTRLEDAPGRAVQSASDSSFDAWIKLYRPDENSLNSTVSYYLKGEIICSLLDIEIRVRTAGARGLDHVLQELFRVYGKEPVPEDGIGPVIDRVAGSSMGAVLSAWVDGRDDLPAAAVLAKVGLVVHREASKKVRGSLGVRLRPLSDSGGRAVVSSVLRGRAAHRAGIDPGDEIVAVGERRIEGGKLDSALSSCALENPVNVVISREGKLRTLTLELDPPARERARLRLHERATTEQKALLQGWLQGIPKPPPRSSDAASRSR